VKSENLELYYTEGMKRDFNQGWMIYKCWFEGGSDNILNWDVEELFNKYVIKRNFIRWWMRGPDRV